ncbi:helix-turn-helix domain-containing protein [Streptococcus didelphis]|uniref:Helix-turn-helix domain-containing protein n=1 Tax=Streptococcus didelphis TaxID=102886 RepID=A0ABY9LFF6_9STRE|nr:helix-turn-helix domain-containing protein [Streptococcus didelphis]WMB27637.1 helix-turn-helix domain-containing protein [Streptococcus didelphis]
MRDKTLGELLRETRVSKNITLDEIENSTGISSHYLLAMELDQFRIIPEEKLDSYLKQYADMVFLDYPMVKELYRRQSIERQKVTEPSVTQLVEEKLSQKKQEEKVVSTATFPLQLNVMQKREQASPSTPVSEVRREKIEVKKEDADRNARKERTRLSRTRDEGKKSKSIFSIVLLTLITLAISIFILFAVWQQFTKENTVKDANNTLVDKNKEKEASDSSSSKKVTTITTQGQDNYLVANVTKAEEAVTVTVSLTDAENSWISLTNSEIGEGGMTLTAENPTYTTSLSPDVKQSILTLGITKGVSVTIDGQPLDLSAITSTDISYITLNIQ